MLPESQKGDLWTPRATKYEYVQPSCTANFGNFSSGRTSLHAAVFPGSLGDASISTIRHRHDHCSEAKLNTKHLSTNARDSTTVSVLILCQAASDLQAAQPPSGPSGDAAPGVAGVAGGRAVARMGLSREPAAAESPTSAVDLQMPLSRTERHCRQRLRSLVTEWLHCNHLHLPRRGANQWVHVLGCRRLAFTIHRVSMAAKLPSENLSMCAPCRKSQWPSDVALSQNCQAKPPRTPAGSHDKDAPRLKRKNLLRFRERTRRPAWKPQRLGPGSRISRAMRSPVSPRAWPKLAAI